jgi:probable F420-dependent oxidoreductase
MAVAIERRPFRFGVQISQAATRAEWTEKARRAEALGYDVLLMPDHLGEQLAIGPALAVAAEATTTLRIGTLVLQNDLRHPALVAKEAATLDLLSEGRFELGLGAGGSWMPDYEATGIPFDPPGARVARLEESLVVLKGLLSGNPLSFAGRHFTFTEFEGFPRPVQRPHPPILVGGGGPRTLALAARQADVVGILPTLLSVGGQFRMEQCRAAAFAEQVDLIRAAAGARFADLELNVLLQRLVVTDDPRRASEDLSREWEPLTPADVLGTPYLLVGTIDGIVETLQERRRRFGVSYLVAFERDMEAFAPVVARLAGT